MTPIDCLVLPAWRVCTAVVNVCRYFLRAKIDRGYVGSVQKKLDLYVQNLEEGPAETKPISLRVGIEDCLHIQFEYDKNA